MTSIAKRDPKKDDQVELSTYNREDIRQKLLPDYEYKLEIVKSFERDEEASPLRTRGRAMTLTSLDEESQDYDKVIKLDQEPRPEVSESSLLTPGSVNSSVLNLIAATMGAGTITMPYIICVAGIGLGSVLTVIGAGLSHYTGNLLIKCTELTGKRTYEDFAEASFGSKRWRSIVSVAMIVSLLGFTTAYVSLSKTLIPSIVEVSVSTETLATLPYWLQNNEKSRAIWATIFAFGVLLPLACFRKLSMLRFTSFFGVVCSATLMFVLIYEFICNEEVVPQPPSSQFKTAEYFNLSWEAIVETFPFIIFLYLYQPNIPPTYMELSTRSPATMNKVLWRANTIAVSCFLLVGVSGYLIFADRAQDQLLDDSRSKNILEADFGESKLIQFSRYLILVAVIAAAPLAVLPAKYAWEAMRHGIQEMSGSENVVVSVVMVVFCYTMALLLPNVGTVIAVTGATVNPFIGYIFPIVFYLKLDPAPALSRAKILAKLTLLCVSIVSLMGLVVLF